MGCKYEKFLSYFDPLSACIFCLRLSSFRVLYELEQIPCVVAIMQPGADLPPIYPLHDFNIVSKGKYTV